MILPDVNVLVYAFRREAADHDLYAAWLADAAGRSEIALAESVLLGFVRIVTNPRIMADPAPTSLALGFVDVLRSAPRARQVVPTAATWAHLAKVVAEDRNVRGHLLPDAWLAALAITHGARLASADRGFARFDGLDWFVPVSAT